MQRRRRSGPRRSLCKTQSWAYPADRKESHGSAAIVLATAAAVVAAAGRACRPAGAAPRPTQPQPSSSPPPRRRPGGATTVGVRLAGRWPGRWLQQTSWVRFPPKVRCYPQLHERRRGFDFLLKCAAIRNCMRGYAAPATPIRPAAPGAAGWTRPGSGALGRE